MVKKTERKVNISGNPKHSLDANRTDGKVKNKDARTGATVRRLQMYNTRPKRNRKGKVLRNKFQSKELPNTRIQPDRGLFGVTRAASQQQIDIFREEQWRIYRGTWEVPGPLGDPKLLLEIFRRTPRTRHEVCAAGWSCRF